MHEQNMAPAIERYMDAQLMTMVAQAEATTLPLSPNSDAEATGSPTAESTAIPQTEQTATLSPTPMLEAESPTDEKTGEPAGTEMPVGIGVEITPMPAPTEELTESPPPTPDITQAPAKAPGGLGDLWGAIGIIALIGVIVFLARLILKSAPATTAKHGTQRAGQRGKGRTSSNGKREAKRKEAAYLPTAPTAAEAKRGKSMQSVSRVSAAQPSPYRIGYAQTIGKRPNQEDSYGASTSDAQIQEKGLLAVVADGIGGMEDGQVASSAVVRTMFSDYAEQSRKMEEADRLLRLAASAQSNVLAINRSAASRCGSTVVSVLAVEDQLSFLSIGDSRIYLYRGGALLQLNREHKYGSGHDENVALGYATESIDARRRAAITSYIGRENMTQIDRNTQPLKLIHGDKILLMTDGVFGTLSTDELVACLDVAAQVSAEQMIAAVERKNMPHQDNATVVIVEYP